MQTTNERNENRRAVRKILTHRAACEAGEMAGTHLRPIRADDLRWMADMTADPHLVGEHNFGGPVDRDDLYRRMRERFADDGYLSATSGNLVVEDDDGLAVGDVSWRTERWGPSAASACPAIGIAILPDHRGRGHGTAAQRLLVDHLFRTYGVHRVQSDTAADNVREQRALEHVGFVREGVVREAEHRDGRYHDHILYSILRAEWEAVQNRDAADLGILDQ